MHVGADFECDTEPRICKALPLRSIAVHFGRRWCRDQHRCKRDQARSPIRRHCSPPLALANSRKPLTPTAFLRIAPSFVILSAQFSNMVAVNGERARGPIIRMAAIVPWPIKSCHSANGQSSPAFPPIASSSGGELRVIARQQISAQLLATPEQPPGRMCFPMVSAA